MKWSLSKIDNIKANSRYSLVGGPFGSNLVSKDYREEGIPVIRGVNLPKGRSFSFDEFVFVSEEKADELFSNNAYPGDVIFTQRGTLGQVGLIPLDSPYQRFIISQSQMKLTVQQELASAEFIYYFFRHPQTIQKVKNLAITSGVPHINLEILKSFELPLPPVAIQRKIVDILRPYDSLIENNLRRIELLEKAALLLYEEWFVRRYYPGYEHTPLVNNIPANWKKCKMNDVCQVVGGGTPSTRQPDYWNGGNISWVVPTDITKNNCLILLDSEKKITEAGLKNSSAKLLPPETILMTSRASVGYFGLIDKEVCTNQGFIAVIPNEENLRMYLLFNLINRKDEILSKAKGTTFPEINKSTFREMDIIIPTKPLLEEFHDNIYIIIKQIRNLKKQSQKLQQARDLLLPKLMSGEIEV